MLALLGTADEIIMQSEGAASGTSLTREILAGFAGAGIAVACLLPIPIVHLVAMPLGPFVGGFVAGNIARPGIRGRAVIAILVGSGVSGVLAIAAALLSSFAQKDELPTWFPAKETLAAIIAGVWLYEATLSAIGATVSVALAQKKSAKPDE
jgi:hypothetical protein